MKLIITLIALTLIAFLITPELLAQPPGPPGSPEQAPLGGLAALAAAGGVYAVKKLRNRERRRVSD